MRFGVFLISRAVKFSLIDRLGQGVGCVRAGHIPADCQNATAAPAIRRWRRQHLHECRDRCSTQFSLRSTVGRTRSSNGSFQKCQQMLQVTPAPAGSAAGYAHSVHQEATRALRLEQRDLQVRVALTHGVRPEPGAAFRRAAVELAPTGRSLYFRSEPVRFPLAAPQAAQAVVSEHRRQAVVAALGATNPYRSKHPRLAQ